MPRRCKPGARKLPVTEPFVFEIITCAPSYSLSVASKSGCRAAMRRHDTYCSNFSCTPVMLTVGLRPGARRAMGLPSNRSRPATNSAVPRGRPVPSASRRSSNSRSSVVNNNSAKCGMRSSTGRTVTNLSSAPRRGLMRA
jgi:hypothetical protein